MPNKKPIPKDATKQRHDVMSKIRSKDTKIEVVLRKALWHEGIRYRKNLASLPGKPDIAITKHKIAIFCDGGFWHGKDWPEKEPRLKSNRDYWIPKIERNMRRDNEVDQTLRNMGWIVIRFWDDDIKKHLENCVDCVKDAIFQARIDSYNVSCEEERYVDAEC